MIFPLFSLRASALAALASLALASCAFAADTPERRWVLGLDAATSTVDGAAGTGGLFIDETSYGMGLHAGRLLSPAFLLRLSAVAADHTSNDPEVTLRVGAAAVEAAYLFRAGQGFRPYFFAGVGGTRFVSRQAGLDWETSGPSLAFGGGWYLRVAGRATLHGALRVQAAAWDDLPATWDSPAGPVAIAAPIASGWTSNVVLGLAFWL